MWSDVLKKPKQGKHFRVFHGAFINVSEHYDDNEERKNMCSVLFPQEGGGAVGDTVLK